MLERSGYRAMLADGTEEGEERWANLLELREVTTRYDDLSADDALDRLLEETALVADQDSYQSDADMLSLITLHAAKGLEFSVVFIAGLEESLFPTGRAVEAESGFNPDPRAMEEERRLAYVGMTRARERLYLSHAWQRATRRGPGHQLDGRAVAVPHRDTRRADERPSPGCPPGGGRGLRRSRRPQSRVRAGCDALRAPDPARRRRVSGGERATRGAPQPERRSSPRAISRHGARRSPAARAPARSAGRPVEAWDEATANGSDEVDAAAGRRRQARRESN